MIFILTLIVPFLGVMIYLFFDNYRLAAQYKSLKDRLLKIADDAQQLNDDFLLEDDVIITHHTVNRLERALHQIEANIALPKSRSITKTYSPRKKKLDLIAKKIKELERAVKEKKA